MGLDDASGVSGGVPSVEASARPRVACFGPYPRGAAFEELSGF